MNNTEKTLKLIEDSINKKCNGLECKVVKNNIDLRLENIQLKKRIDLMTKWIEKHTKYYDEDGCYCELKKEICRKDIDCIDCIDCIKQYFEASNLDLLILSFKML